VPGLSPRESPAVYVDPLPFHGRIISDKDEVRNSTLFCAVNTQVGAVSITKEFAFAIFLRKLTAGTDHRRLPIRRSQCVRRIRDAGDLVISPQGLLLPGSDPAAGDVEGLAVALRSGVTG